MTEFFRELQNSYEQVNLVLKHYLSMFSRQEESLIKAMYHGVFMGGKRIRPFLVYQIGRLFGLRSENLDAPAAAIECMHAYSLIHDDLPSMDNDILRRNKPSCHIKYGEKTAILAGNALQTLAFFILSTAPMSEVETTDRIKMISTLAEASGANGMCLGQALDLSVKGKKISTKFLENIYKHKTGALIRAAVYMGSLAARERSCQVLKFLDRYACSVGLAFQIKDDIIDLIQDRKKIENKQKYSSKKLGKSTYPPLLELDVARNKANILYCESLVSLKYISELGYDTSMLANLSRYIIERDK